MSHLDRDAGSASSEESLVIQHSSYKMPPLKSDQKSSIPVPSWVLGMGAALLYGVCSSSMAFANKGLLSSYHFNFQATLMAIQMAFTIVVLEILRGLEMIKIPRYSFSQGYSFALPSLFYAINSVLGLRALTGMNIPMYTVIKRCTPVVCLFLRPLLLKNSKPPTLSIIGSVAMITIGCVLAAYGDLSFDLVAYTYGSLSVIVQGLYLTLVQSVSQTKVSTSHSLYLNAYNTLPVLVLYAAVFGELQAAAQFPDYANQGFVLLLLAVVSMGCILNYSLFLCTNLNSALTTTVVGGMKGVAQTVIGIFTFGGIDLNIFNIFGLTINASGGIFYAFFKFMQRGGEP